MKAKRLSLSKLLRSHKAGEAISTSDKHWELEDLQLKMLRIQQGIWHQGHKVIIVFEGFDAAGKGGAIRRVVEPLDPRGFRVYPIGPPSPDEQGKHYLYRFWQKLPAPGTLAIFDRSWYGRVLVERVDCLTPKDRWKAAYQEIREFEQSLQAEGITLIKIFLAIDRAEQLKRFESRLKNPYKRWKLGPDDIRARTQWPEYVKAVDDLFAQTHTRSAPWHLIPANDKHFARAEALRIITDQLKTAGIWMEKTASKLNSRSLSETLKKMGLSEKSIR